MALTVCQECHTRDPDHQESGGHATVNGGMPYLCGPVVKLNTHGPRLSVGLKITYQDPGHTHLTVFSALAREDDDRKWADIQRGSCGRLILRTDEFEVLAHRLLLLDGPTTHVDVYHEGQDEHPCGAADEVGT